MTKVPSTFLERVGRPDAVQRADAGTSGLLRARESPPADRSLTIGAVLMDNDRAISQGDHSHVPWSEAPDWLHESLLLGVRRALEGATPEELHQAWVAHKLNSGWKHGPVKDAQLRTHPCLVPYDKLPPEQLRKDTLFHAVVEALR